MHLKSKNPYGSTKPVYNQAPAHPSILNSRSLIFTVFQSPLPLWTFPSSFLFQYHFLCSFLFPSTLCLTNACTFSRSQIQCHPFKETFPDSVIYVKFSSYMLLVYLILFLRDPWYGHHNLYLFPWYMFNGFLPPNVLLCPLTLHSPVNSPIGLTCFVPTGSSLRTYNTLDPCWIN